MSEWFKIIICYYSPLNVLVMYVEYNCKKKSSSSSLLVSVQRVEEKNIWSFLICCSKERIYGYGSFIGCSIKPSNFMKTNYVHKLALVTEF